MYKYDTIVNALCSKQSNIIELNLCEPVCIRRRRSSLTQPSVDKNPDSYRTVVINGLPRDAKHEELIEFFNRFHPVYKINMLSTSGTISSFSGKIHVIFEKSQDALAFVRKSQLTSIIYVNDDLLQVCNGYILVCKMLVDCDAKNEENLIKKNRTQLHSPSGKYLK